jgi:hypothetical protein
MTRKISLITAVAVTALAVGVPTAFGEGRLAGSQEPDGVAFFRANELATLAQQSSAPVSTYRDAHERGNAVVNQSEPQWLKALAARSEGLNRIHRLGEFAGSTQTLSPELKALQARSEGLNRKYGLGEFAASTDVSTYRDAGERAVPPTGSEPVTITSSGREIEWPQVGAGLMIGRSWCSASAGHADEAHPPAH